MTDTTVKTATASNIKLEFLNGWTIDIERIPKYSEFEGDFYEQLDRQLAEIIINSKLRIPQPGDKKPSDEGYVHMNPISELGKANFKKAIFDRLPNNGVNIVRHHNRHKLGRYYGDANSSIVVQARQIKHTLFSYMGYKDLDQKKSHPSIALMVGKSNGVEFPSIAHYVNEESNKVMLDIIIDHFSIKTGDKDFIKANRLSPDDVKRLFNITLYGGGVSTWIKETEKGNPNRCIEAKQICEDSKRYNEFVDSQKTENCKYKLPKCYVDFRDDCSRLKDHIVNNNYFLEEAVRNMEKDKDGQERTTVSYFFQIIENHTLYHTYLYLIRLKVIKPRWVCLEYDGLCLPRFSVKFNDGELVNMLDKYIYDLTGLSIRYKIKGYEQCNVHTDLIAERKKISYEIFYACKTYLKLKTQTEYYEIDRNSEKTASDAKKMSVLLKLIEKLEKEEITQDKKLIKDAEAHSTECRKREEEEKYKDAYVCNEDADAAQYVLDKLGDTLINIKTQLYYCVRNVWRYGPIVNDHLLEYILKSGIRKKTPKGSVCYSGDFKNATNILKVMLTKIKTGDSFVHPVYGKMHSTTRGKICFLDGVLDFTKQKFYTWDEVNGDAGFEYYTTMQINRNFKPYFDNPNEKDIADVKMNIIDNLFPDNVDKALHFLSRAVAGETLDKNWATYLGNRDCGKGVLFDVLKKGFEDYVDVFRLSNIMYQRRSPKKEDTSLANFWLLDLEWPRLAISQEIPEPAMQMRADGNKIKGYLASGGDTQVARRNFDRFDTKFKVDATVLIMGNYTLDVDTKDALEHCVEFNSVIQYKTQKQLDAMESKGYDKLMTSIYSISNPQVKINSDTLEWGNAMIMLLLRSYRPDPVEVERGMDDDDHNIPLRELIFMKYKITGKDSDILVASDVEEELGNDKKKIIIEFKSINGVVRKKNNIKKDENLGKQCYFGLRLLNEQELEIQALSRSLMRAKSHEQTLSKIIPTVAQDILNQAQEATKQAQDALKHAQDALAKVDQPVMSQVASAPAVSMFAQQSQNALVKKEEQPIPIQPSKKVLPPVIPRFTQLPKVSIVKQKAEIDDLDYSTIEYESDNDVDHEEFNAMYEDIEEE